MPKAEADVTRWMEDQRQAAETYLRKKKVDHLGVGEYPAFDVHPCVALWTVQSKKAPGWVGWWAISGDLPTDYISRNEAQNPRDALRAFVRHWLEVSDLMLRGGKHPDYSVGRPEEWPELGDLLRRRALVLQTWADDNAMWDEEGGPVATAAASP